MNMVGKVLQMSFLECIILVWYQKANNRNHDHF